MEGALTEKDERIKLLEKQVELLQGVGDQFDHQEEKEIVPEDVVIPERPEATEPTFHIPAFLNL